MVDLEKLGNKRDNQIALVTYVILTGLFIVLADYAKFFLSESIPHREVFYYICIAFMIFFIICIRITIGHIAKLKKAGKWN